MNKKLKKQFFGIGWFVPAKETFDETGRQICKVVCSISGGVSCKYSSFQGIEESVIYQKENCFVVDNDTYQKLKDIRKEDMPVNIFYVNTSATVEEIKALTEKIQQMVNNHFEQN